MSPRDYKYYRVNSTSPFTRLFFKLGHSGLEFSESSGAYIADLSRPTLVFVS